MGANCSPSDPGCPFGAGCDPGETRACINFCPPEWDPAGGAASQWCPLDPCDADAYAVPNTFACPSEFRCMREPSCSEIFCPPPERDLNRFGHCQAASGYLEPCTVESDMCGDGSFCAAASCGPAGQVINAFGYPAATEGVCMLPIREGGLCDSNIVNAASTGMDGTPIVLGCLPCEPGTWCLANSISGIAGPPEERRCVRSCDVAGTPSADRCDCSNPLCTERSPVPLIDAASGRDMGRFFCEPCLANNRETCGDEADLACCDEANGSTCHVGVTVDVPPGATRDLCCRGAGVDCSDDPDACCAGTRCDAGACLPCGRDGADADVAACCRGWVAVGPPGGPRSCERCSVSGEECGEEFFELSNTDGIDAIAVPDTHVAWWRVRGNAGGNLLTTAGNALDARYLLTDEHRAFLLDDTLGTFGAGSVSTLLRANIPGVVQDFGLAETDQRGVAIYDGGACSYVARWPLVATLFPIFVNRYLSDLANAEPLTPTVFTLTPRPNAHPRTALLPLGPLDDDSQLDVHLEYTTASIGGCPDRTVRIDASVLVDRVPARVQNDSELAIDLFATTEPRCDYAGGVLWWCRLIRAIDDVNDRITWREEYWEVHEDADEDAMERVGCVIDGDDYRCFEPAPLGTLEFITQRYRRPYTTLDHTYDLALRLASLTVDLNDPCAAEPSAANVVRPVVDRALAGISAELTRSITRRFGTSLTQDFGVPASELRTCSTNWQCMFTPVEGGRRHRCCFDGTSATCNFARCDDATIEVRRAHVRPDGIELVLAEDRGDPQFALLEGVPGLAAPGGPLAILFGADPDLCDPTRHASDVDEETVSTATPAVPVVFDEPGLPRFDVLDQPICDTTNPNCSGICPEVGLTCEMATTFGFPGGGGRILATTDTVCARGVCAPPPP